MFVPGLVLKKIPSGLSSAILATSVLLGSITIILAPFSTASLTFRPTMGWASVVFDPQTRRQSVPTI